MIIKNIRKGFISEYAVLQGEISWNKSEFKKLYIAVPKEFEAYLDETSADPFVISFIQIAAKYDEEIIVEDASVSVELADNIENVLIPTFNKLKLGSGKTKIVADKVLEEASDKKIGATGISCGVDSFYAILSNLKENNKELPIDACCVICGKKNIEEIEKQFVEKNKKRKTVCDSLSLKFIPIFNNFNYFIEPEFNNDFQIYHTFYRVGVITSIKNLIGWYYYATGYVDDKMVLDLHDTACYENIIRKVINYNSFKMLSSGSNTNRFEKTKYISKENVVRNYLDVCYHGEHHNENYLNCSSCAKCIRTMVTLDMLGILENFNNIFDVDLFKKKKWEYVADIIYKSVVNKDILAKEIFHNFKKYNYKINVKTYCYFGQIAVKQLIKKIKK